MTRKKTKDTAHTHERTCACAVLEPDAESEQAQQQHTPEISWSWNLGSLAQLARGGIAVGAHRVPVTTRRRLTDSAGEQTNE